MISKKPASGKSPAKAGATVTEAARVARIVSAHYAEIIEGERAAVEAGDGDALLSAILTALISRDPFPEWLGNKLAGAIYRYQGHEAYSLDEAFNVSRPSGYRQKARRDQRQAGAALSFDVWELKRAGAVIDEALFTAVGTLHGVKKTTATKWYYWYCKRGYLPPAGSPIPRSALSERLRVIESEIEWSKT